MWKTGEKKEKGFGGVTRVEQVRTGSKIESGKQRDKI
jgi:hypothetical protein